MLSTQGETWEIFVTCNATNKTTVYWYTIVKQYTISIPHYTMHFTVYHSISQYTTIYHSISQYITVYYSPLEPVILLARFPHFNCSQFKIFSSYLSIGMTTSFLHVVLPQLPPRKTSQNGGGGGGEEGEGQIQSTCVCVRRGLPGFTSLDQGGGSVPIADIKVQFPSPFEEVKWMCVCVCVCVCVQ